MVKSDKEMLARVLREMEKPHDTETIMFIMELATMQMKDKELVKEAFIQFIEDNILNDLE